MRSADRMLWTTKLKTFCINLHILQHERTLGSDVSSWNNEKHADPYGDIYRAWRLSEKGKKMLQQKRDEECGHHRKGPNSPPPEMDLTPVEEESNEEESDEEESDEEENIEQESADDADGSTVASHHAE